MKPSNGSEPTFSPATSIDRTRLIVGIGASAGGIDAFQSFFARMPADTGMAFVLVQHLDPNHDSSLVAIIAGYTTMPVHLAEGGEQIRPNHVYVIPPNTILTIKSNVLHLDSPAPPAARRTSINTFLTSLAEDQGENAVGIILSGFGSDGALGIAAIKEQGGLTLSQAEFDHHAKSGMPQSAASGGFVDHVLAVEDMPAALVEYRNHRKIGDAEKGPDGIRQDLPSHLATICAVLHSRLGRDFSQYKTGTLMRRIQRRMHVLQTDKVTSYIEQLRSLPHEAELLFRELLIGVTRFFRDAEAFEVLEATIIPILLMERADTEPIRVWVAGCATGEEAYSIAILLKEALGRAESRRPVKIFATDLDDRAIEAARAGLYLAAIVADLSPERLERHFVKEDGNYRVAKDLREMCLFTTHDLVQDPPFSQLDLVSCRNLLIYLQPQLQHRVLTTFHYALRPSRHLFLGPAETITAQPHLFAPLDKRHRIYVRQDGVGRLPAFPLGHASFSTTPLPPHPPQASRSSGLVEDDIDRRAARAMARHAPAYLVVNSRHDILRFSGQTAKYLEPASGIASLRLFSLLHPDLRTAATALLQKAAATGTRALSGPVSMETGDAYERVKLIVEPLSSAGEEGLYVLVFQVVEAAPILANAAGPAVPAEGQAATIKALNLELLEARERLRRLADELQASNEELRSANEEYLSANEELRSVNEELVTSKEELQSLNEELQTINAELNHRNDSLVRSNSDLANLFDSTSIAILFLDRDLRIRRFTPRLLEIFKLREGDEGRPITDIVTHLTQAGLSQDVQEVLRTLAPIEREVRGADATTYLMQVRPYRALNDTIDGVVVAFIDLAERKKHEQARALLAAIVDSSQDAIISHDLNGIITSWNEGAEQLYGYPAEEALGQSLSELLGEALPEDWPLVLARLEKGERIADVDSARTGRNGQLLEVSITVSPVRQGDGRIVGASMVARDISARKAAERKAALLLGELDHRVKNILAVVSAVVSQTLRGNPEPKLFAAEVEGRIKAIAKAHSLLTQAGNGQMSLHAIFATELAPYERGNGHLVITGPDVALTPKAGLALAMAVHELASNAAKYGALSTTSGQLAVSWDVAAKSSERLLTLSWIEAGGPPVAPPFRRGFGTTLIERTLTHELDAEVSREFRVDGLHCSMTLPVIEEVGQLWIGDKAGGQSDDQ
ncbi:CheR family methyltransferase [Geminicoccus harenae]|uniref:CheR family methyltransferase n=2 Tax=Geminicoccus TaxID=489140 RepID=UPI00168A5130|nr:CheR family methyltransferase [Geminicoccus harenae]